jgi:hypothetical protein
MRPMLAIVLGSSLAGCALHSSDNATPPPPPESATLATNAMWPSMSAQSDGQSIRVYAAVLEGSDFVVLSDGEYFIATGAGQSIQMQREAYTDGSKIHYLATFPAQTTATNITIDFHRASGRVEAAMSQAIVAPAFAITSAAPPSFKLGTNLSIAISPVVATKGDVTDRMAIAVTGDCIDDTTPTTTATFDVDGATIFDSSLIKLKKGSTGCDVGVQVRHETLGKSDPAFQNGGQTNVEGLQARSFNTSIVL